MIDHRGALNTVVDVNRRFGVGPDDRVLALSSLSFDLSVYDLFGLLAAGGALVLPEPDARRDPARWLELLARRTGDALEHGAGAAGDAGASTAVAPAICRRVACGWRCCPATGSR